MVEEQTNNAAAYKAFAHRHGMYRFVPTWLHHCSSHIHSTGASPPDMRLVLRVSAMSFAKGHIGGNFAFPRAASLAGASLRFNFD
jgi:hypothetical protein